MYYIEMRLQMLTLLSLSPNISQYLPISPNIPDIDPTTRRLHFSVLRGATKIKSGYCNIF